jgi:hypothetical protein
VQDLYNHRMLLQIALQLPRHDEESLFGDQFLRWSVLEASGNMQYTKYDKAAESNN